MKYYKMITHLTRTKPKYTELMENRNTDLKAALCNIFVIIVFPNDSQLFHILTVCLALVACRICNCDVGPNRMERERL